MLVQSNLDNPDMLAKRINIQLQIMAENRSCSFIAMTHRNQPVAEAYENTRQNR